MHPEVEAHLERGYAFQAAGRLPQAIQAFEAAVRLDAGDARAHFALGQALSRQGRLTESLGSYDRALALKSDFAEAISHRANVLTCLSRLDEALEAYDRLLAVKPEAALSVWYNRGNVLRLAGRCEEAVASYDRALALNPSDIEAWVNRGVALHALRRMDEAMASFARALALNPTCPEALAARGNAFRDQQRYADALADYRAALAARPDFVTALFDLGETLGAMGQHEEAATAFSRLVEASPDFDYAMGDWLHECQHCCDWAMFDELVNKVVRSVNEGRHAVYPFSFLSISDSPSAQLQCARSFAAAHCPARPVIGPRRPRTRDRIRLGYLSGDFHNHATAYLAAGLFEAHDRSRFEVIAYSFGPDDKGAMRRRLAAAFDRFADVSGASDQAIAERLIADGIDIAVDLKGFTQNARPGILALRPAPVQVAYLGYPGTMGCDFIDYLIADDYVIPSGLETFYSEKIVRLPHCYQVNDSRREIAPRTPSRAELGLPEPGFVFCCFNNAYKLNPPMFDVWMRLLSRVENGVLWLLEAGRAAAGNLRREASRCGVAPERLVFAPRTALPDHLARHRTADLFLDTLPYNAHTTASDALWAGVPVLTCPGQAFASRVAGSLLHAVNLPEFVTSSLDEYESLAFRLATQPAELATFKKRLAEARSSAPLFDTQRFTRNLEAAYRQMWERYCARERPASFTVAEPESNS